MSVENWGDFGLGFWGGVFLTILVYEATRVRRLQKELASARCEARMSGRLASRYEQFFKSGLAWTEKLIQAAAILRADKRRGDKAVAEARGLVESVSTEMVAMAARVLFGKDVPSPAALPDIMDLGAEVQYPDGPAGDSGQAAPAATEAEDGTQPGG